MPTVTLRALAGFANLAVVMFLSIFLPAWSLDFWQGWVFLAAFLGPVLFITLYFLRKDPLLITRRLKAGPLAERRKKQKFIQTLASFFFILILLVPGFDHRLRWSTVPDLLALASDAAVVLGLLIVFFVFKENSYTSSAIEVTSKQSVISTGPYSAVRHPMYSGALLTLTFTPVALGSFCSILLVLPMILLIILRILDEEELLLHELPGYREYCKKVRYRLLPRIW